MWIHSQKPRISAVKIQHSAASNSAGIGKSGKECLAAVAARQKRCDFIDRLDC